MLEGTPEVGVAEEAMENVTQAEEAEANLEATQEVAATPEEAEGAATATQANEKVETEMAEETEDATQTKYKDEEQAPVSVMSTTVREWFWFSLSRVVTMPPGRSRVNT